MTKIQKIFMVSWDRIVQCLHMIILEDDFRYFEFLRSEMKNHVYILE